MPETTAKTRQKAATSAAKPKAKGKVASAKIGAPTTFSQKTADLICIMLSEGMSLREILRSDTTGVLPAQSTVYEWLLRHPSFAEQYARAREEQADTLADEIIQIADERPELSPLIDKKTGEVLSMDLSSAYIQWQKNRIEARKWTAMKLKPKKYGDRVALEGVEGGAPIATEDATSTRLFELMRNMEMTKRVG
jgi:hypothetical protein